MSRLFFFLGTLSWAMLFSRMGGGGFATFFSQGCGAAPGSLRSSWRAFLGFLRALPAAPFLPPPPTPLQRRGAILCFPSFDSQKSSGVWRGCLDRNFGRGRPQKRARPMASEGALRFFGAAGWLPFGNLFHSPPTILVEKDLASLDPPPAIADGQKGGREAGDPRGRIRMAPAPLWR